MCEHQYAKHHPKEDCIICFHAIFERNSYQEIIDLLKEKEMKPIRKQVNSSGNEKK